MEPVDQILCFFFYSFAGWVLESIYATYLDSKFINRGFLKGPFCPLYGFAALIIIQIFYGIELLQLGSLNALMLGILFSIIVATLLEYAAGTILEKAFNVRLWDYGDEPLNVDGHICIKYSLLWGVLAFTVITVVQPIITLEFLRIPEEDKEIITVLFVFAIFADTVMSVNEQISEYGPGRRLNEKIKEFEIQFRSRYL